MPQPTPGQNFGPYAVIAPLGRGGMAAVYRAFDPQLDREVALKVLPAELTQQPGFGERFEREARLIARLEHPNIVPLYASGIEDGVPWMALRLVPGGTMQDRLETGTLAQGEGFALFRQVARALDYAHAQGVVHRDLKPQNLLIGLGGEVYLADFGIARLIEGGSALTGTGAVLGTPLYMAPEQAQGLSIGPPCDLYALAVMLFLWQCGEVPFNAETPVAVLLKHVQEPIPDAPLARLPASAQDVLRRGLAKDPEARWPTATAMVDALEESLRAASPNERRSQSSTVAARPTTAPARASAPSAVAATSSVPARRRFPAVLLIAALVVVTGLGYLWQQDWVIGIVSEPAAPPSAPIAQVPVEADPVADPSHDNAAELQDEPASPRQDAPTGAVVDSGPALAAIPTDEPTPRPAPAQSPAQGAPDESQRPSPPYREAVDEGGQARRDEAAARLAAERSEAARLEAERMEAERLAAERIEAERLDAQRLEADRSAAERLNAERLEADRLTAERLAAERERVRAVQVELRRLGRDVGSAGQLDEGTVRQIRTFAEAVDVEVSGDDAASLVTDALLQALTDAKRWPVLAPGSRFQDCEECPEMVVIPAGSFTMGSPLREPQRQLNEGPQREVRIGSFALARTEVTFDQWQACVDDGDCAHQPDDQGWGRGDRPVIDVSWNDAQQYVGWLARRTGLRYRLPSEAEWEYAVRAGTTTRTYRGDCIGPDEANYNGAMPARGCPRGEFRQRTLPVASFKPNGFGLHDMHGNVWEWMQDCTNFTHTRATEDGQPRSDGDCSKAVVRGAGWHDWGFWVRSAARYGFPRSSRHPYGGFRPAVSLP